MTEQPKSKPVRPTSPLGQEVGAKAARKLKARRNSTPGVWFGLGMMGLVGWSVVVPTLLGAALSGRPLLDVGSASHRPRDRLLECVALGGQARRGNAGRGGGWR